MTIRTHANREHCKDNPMPSLIYKEGSTTIERITYCREDN